MLLSTIKITSPEILFLIWITLIIPIFFMIIHYFRKLNQLKTQERYLEIEKKLLAEKISPHFIFNSLNVLQRFILECNKSKANEYLTCFSSFLRDLIAKLNKTTISLNDEIDFLKQYLELEKIRLENLTYSIKIDKNVTLNTIKIPSLLVYLFIESFIWSGIPRNKEKRFLFIHFYLEKNTVCCLIKDNAIRKNIDMLQKNYMKENSLLNNVLKLYNHNEKRKNNRKKIEIQPYFEKNEQDEICFSQLKIMFW